MTRHTLSTELPALLMPKVDPLPLYEVTWLEVPFDFQGIVAAIDEYRRTVDSLYSVE